MQTASPSARRRRTRRKAAHYPPVGGTVEAVAKRKNATCRRCGEHRDDVGPLSYNGLCATCGVGTAADTMRQMAAKQGPKYDAYRRGVIELAKRFESELAG